MAETIIRMPDCVAKRYVELMALCEKYPITIPADKAAKFLGMAPESLRESISTGSCPFGFGWQKTAGGNRGFCIPTHLFFVCNAPQLAYKTSVRWAEANNPYHGYIDKESGLF